MIGNIFSKIFGSKNDRELKRMGKVVKQINALEEELQKLSDDELKQKTQEFKTGLPKPIGELMPALSVIRNIFSRNTLAPRATDF